MEVSPWAVQRLVYERLGIEFDLTPWEVEEAFLRAARSWTPEPGIAQALERLSELGLPLAVLSNSAFSSQALTSQLEQHGLARFFRFVMSSADYVVRKPHPAFFHTGAGKLGVEPEGVWYVGDMAQYDVVGARAAGMVSVLYAPGDHASADPRPDAIVSDWGSFADLVTASF